MQAKYYAEAFDAALASGTIPEVASQNLVTVATRRGQKHLLPAIARAISARVARREAAKVLTVTSALPLSEEELGIEISRADIGHYDHVVRHVDETLVSGSIVQKGALRVDASGKTLLLNIYKKLVA